MALISKGPTVEELNSLITMPAKLLCSDGREIIVNRWAPVIDKGSWVEVALTGVIIPPPEHKPS